MHLLTVKMVIDSIPDALRDVIRERDRACPAQVSGIGCDLENDGATEFQNSQYLGDAVDLFRQSVFCFRWRSGAELLHHTIYARH
jgi:hypothetical protein